jgi:D-alanyl-D-alanine carboxypeptidase
MFIDETSYQLSKFFRSLKLLVRQIDRDQILRIAGILLVVLAVLGSSPQDSRKSLIVNRKSEEPEVRGVEEGAGEEKSLALKPPLERGSGESSAPEASVSAQAAYFVDNQTNTVLYEKNSNQRLPMASLTKIMTALVVLENYQLDEVVAVPELCTHLPPLKVGYAAGQKLTVEELLYGMLVTSASDASCTLSHNYEGDFLQSMNQKAIDLGLNRTHFENEIGFAGANGNHLSTAQDLVKLSQTALENGVFRKIVGTAQWRNLVSTNELLFTRPGTTGIKTGYTEQARGCLAVSYERGGREIIGVLLGSEDRFADARTILDWIFK